MVEIGVIIFLLYSTLLMREFTHANGQGKNLASAIQDILTVTASVIAVISGLFGYVVIEYLRRRLESPP
jgi:hypothetical protein